MTQWLYTHTHTGCCYTVRQVIFEGSKFRGCSINFILAGQIFAGRGILATPTKWCLLVALRWMACWCSHAH